MSKDNLKKIYIGKDKCKMFKKIPNEVEAIISTLSRNGFEAYIVGGCIRDLLIGKSPKDWDIVTSATPDEVTKLFEKTIPTGLRYGTVTVVLNDTNFEVTTYRTNEIYTNHRKPDSVNFTTNLESDLERRDFTMNAIAYNDKKGVIDIFEGQKDIQNKTIKTVGDANIRFEEDALRMLRAIRFSSQLDFSIDETAILAIKQNAELITKVSIERIENELSKILMSEHPEKFILVHQTGLLKLILPKLYSSKNVPIDDILETSLKQVSSAIHSLDIRWAILFSNILDKTFDTLDVITVLKDIIKSLKFSNDIRDAVVNLVRYRNYNLTSEQYSLKVLLSDIGTSNLAKVIEFLRCTRQDFDYDGVCKAYKEVLQRSEPIFLSDLDITGNDIQVLGAEGEEIGEVLDCLLSHCLEYPEDNKKDKLLELAKEKLQQISDLDEEVKFSNFIQQKEAWELSNKLNEFDEKSFKECIDVEEKLLAFALKFTKNRIQKQLQKETAPAKITEFKELLNILNDKEAMDDLTNEIRQNLKAKLGQQKDN